MEAGGVRKVGKVRICDFRRSIIGVEGLSQKEKEIISRTVVKEVGKSRTKKVSDFDCGWAVGAMGEFLPPQTFNQIRSAGRRFLYGE